MFALKSVNLLWVTCEKNERKIRLSMDKLLRDSGLDGYRFMRWQPIKRKGSDLTSDDRVIGPLISHIIVDTRIQIQMTEMTRHLNVVSTQCDLVLDPCITGLGAK